MHGLYLQIKELSAAFIETENQLEKTNRDKVQLMSELEVARSHLDNNDVDYSKATDSMKMSVTHATIERNAAVKEAARCKQRVIDAEREADEERERLTSDRNDLKRRLAKAEQELVDTKEQCITLTTNMQQLEREAHMYKLAKDTVERNRTDDLKDMTQRAEKREAELNGVIDKMEVTHGRAVMELEDMIASHQSLAHKLQEECKRLTTNLESLSSRYKCDKNAS